MSGRIGHLVGFAALLAAVLVVANPESGRTQVSPSGPLPLLGAIDAGTTLIGAAPGGQPGEPGGYRQLPLAVGEVRTANGKLAFGPVSNPGLPDPQLAFLRYTEGNGWQVFDTPVDELGNP